jgi:ADP-ribose pyrophosphatase YjhB (NUDIX family)
MKRTRSAGIVIRDEKVLLMRRKNHGHEYWSFPGGHVDVSEKNEDACAREVYEETGVAVVVKRCVYKVVWDTGHTELFFLCDYVSGEPHLRPDSIEARITETSDQEFEPCWVPYSTVHDMLVYPLEIRDLFLSDIPTEFPPEPIVLNLVLVERREKI